MLAWLLIGAATDASQLDGEDYQHGIDQVEQLLIDRPTMAQLLIDNDPLLVWTRAQFAGVSTGFRIHWDKTYPSGGAEAQHQSVSHPGMPDQARILVHGDNQTGSLKGQPKTAHNLWADLVFELFNIRQSDVFNSAYQHALAGQLSYAGWIRALTEAEHQALVETADFYRTHWRVWMRDRQVNPISIRWLALQDVPTAYLEWIMRYSDPNGYPYSAYGQFYRDEITPYLIQRDLQYRYNPFSLPEVSSAKDHGNADPEQQD